MNERYFLAPRNIFESVKEGLAILRTTLEKSHSDGLTTLGIGVGVAAIIALAIDRHSR